MAGARAAMGAEVEIDFGCGAAEEVNLVWATLVELNRGPGS